MREKSKMLPGEKVYLMAAQIDEGCKGEETPFIYPYSYEIVEAKVKSHDQEKGIVWLWINQALGDYDENLILRSEK